MEGKGRESDNMISCNPEMSALRKETFLAAFFKLVMQVDCIDSLPIKNRQKVLFMVTGNVSLPSSNCVSDVQSSLPMWHAFILVLLIKHLTNFAFHS